MSIPKTIKNGFAINLAFLAICFCRFKKIGYIVMLHARMFRSLIIRTGIIERNVRARNITI